MPKLRAFSLKGCIDLQFQGGLEVRTLERRLVQGDSFGYNYLILGWIGPQHSRPGCVRWCELSSWRSWIIWIMSIGYSLEVFVGQLLLFRQNYFRL
jgi:hypothetical protein